MRKSLVAAAVAAASLAVAAPALAKSEGAFGPVTGYVNLGYAYTDLDPGKFHVLGGRLGARFGRYVGVEGEGGFGVNTQTISGVALKLQSEYAAYGIGFLPISPKADVFARVGYGHSSIKGTLAGVSTSLGEDSVNYGGGVQFFWTDKDGTRAEFTRHDFRNGGGAANVFAISYVRRFP